MPDKPIPQPHPTRTLWELVKQALLLLLAVLALVVAIKGLLMPNHLLSGGVTGLSLLLNALFKWPVGLLTLLFNVPIFIAGFRDLGRKFVVYSGLAILLFWLAMDHLPVPQLTHDPLLAGIFGGLIGGVGSALAIQAGGSLGGFDILGVVLNRRFSLGMGEAGLIMNGALITAAGIIDTPERAMYTLISIYVASRTLDTLQAPARRKAVLIVSKQSAAIKERIMFQMGRGVTLLKAEGAFTGDENNVLLCVMTRYELQEFKALVNEEDPEAFVTVFEASDVIGRFRRPTAFDIWKKQGKKAAGDRR